MPALTTRRFVPAACLLLCFALLTGCAVHYSDPTPTVTTEGISGAVFGGEQPIVGATVALFAVGNSGYGTGATQITTVPANATTDAQGNYAFSSITCPNQKSGIPTYLLVTGGNAGGGVNPHIVLAAGTGPCSGLGSLTVNVSEVTTAATAFAMGQFFTQTVGGAPSTDMFGGTKLDGTYNVGLMNADFYTVPLLVNLAAASTVSARTTTTSGTMTITRESAKLYTIANILLACVNSSGSTAAGSNCNTLFTSTADPSGTASADTLQAAVMMSYYPYNNVARLYALQTGSPPFAGGLTTQPNDWTLGISYTSTAFQNNLLTTSTFRSGTNIDIDAAGNVWFPTNSATSHGIGELFFGTTPSFGGPYLTGLTHPQYLAITTQGRIYATDTAAGKVAYTTVLSPSPTGTTLAVNFGNTGPIVASPSTASGDDLVFTTGGTASALGSSSYRLGYTYPGTANDYGALQTYSHPPAGLAGYSGVTDYIFAATSGSSTTCTMESGSSGPANLDVTTGTAPCYAGGIAQTSYSSSSQFDAVMTVPSANRLCDYQATGTSGACFTPLVALNYPQAVAVDGAQNVWIANYGNASVSTLGYSYNAGTSADYYTTSTIPFLHGATRGNTLTTPSGIAIDRSGNVWIANACISQLTTCPASFTLSELIGAAFPTQTPLAAGVVLGTTGTLPQFIAAPVTGQVNAQSVHSAGQFPRRR